MRLTRRGHGLVVVIAAALLSAYLHGPRGLNAVFAPGFVALGAAAVQVYRARLPEMERHLPERGTRGDTVTVRFEVDADDPVSGYLHDEIDEGLAADGNDRMVTLYTESVEYELTLNSRGMQVVGPLAIEVTDVLGLVSGTRRYDERDRILVRPRVRPLSVRPGEVHADHGDLGPERNAFEYLREYEPGDPIRDIHWKSSAKTAEGFLVTEFSADDEGGVDAVTIGVEAISGDHDATADAAASLAVFMLDSGLEVGLRTYTTEIAPSGRVEHQDRILDFLAHDRYITGTLPDRFRSEVDLLVRGTEDGVTLETGERTVELWDHLGPAAVDAIDDADPTPT